MAMEGLNKELTGDILPAITAALVITQGPGETFLSDRNLLVCMKALLGMMRVGGGIRMEAGQALCQVVRGVGHLNLILGTEAWEPEIIHRQEEIHL